MNPKCHAEPPKNVAWLLGAYPPIATAERNRSRPTNKLFHANTCIRAQWARVRTIKDLQRYVDFNLLYFKAILKILQRPCPLVFGIV
jgi:hypothetical protein